MKVLQSCMSSSAATRSSWASTALGGNGPAEDVRQSAYWTASGLRVPAAVATRLVVSFHGAGGTKPAVIVRLPDFLSDKRHNIHAKVGHVGPCQGC